MRSVFLIERMNKKERKEGKKNDYVILHIWYKKGVL